MTSNEAFEWAATAAIVLIMAAFICWMINEFLRKNKGHS